jgi:leucyl/phenylalanyl-tRNA--protein transferase
MSLPSVIDADGFPITPEVVLAAYRQGCFPMADSRGGRLRWYRPQSRAVITWDRWRVPKSLSKVARNRRPYHITIDRAFERVIAACAERESTWISRDVEQLYTAMHTCGHAHSVEAWDSSGDLVGGCYGLALGGIYCGESMFHRAPDAAKLCVMFLVERLQANGFAVLDCQQQTPHMERFGAYEIDEDAYAELLAEHHAPRPFP